MLTKAYIQEVINPHSIRVRIPLYNKIADVEGSTPNKELGVACVCTLPNFITSANVGDVVIVGFEENIISKPVVLGYLSTANEKESLTDIVCDQLTAKGDVVLDEHTTIGNVKPESIKCLKDLKNNIKDTFEATSKDIAAINTTISEIENNVLTNTSNIYTIQSDSLVGIHNSISNISSRVDQLETDYTNLLNKFNDYLLRQSPILGNLAYGEDTNKPTNPVEGQVYFTLKKEDE